MKTALLLGSAFAIGLLFSACENPTTAASTVNTSNTTSAQEIATADSLAIELGFPAMPHRGPDSLAKAVCQLPILDSATKATVDSLHQAHSPLPAGLLPALSDVQKSCLDSLRATRPDFANKGHKGPDGRHGPKGKGPHHPPFELIKKVGAACGLTAPDSAQRELMMSFHKNHQQVPDSLRPVLTEVQKACVDSSFKANKPVR